MAMGQKRLPQKTYWLKENRSKPVVPVGLFFLTQLPMSVPSGPELQSEESKESLPYAATERREGMEFP